MTPYVISKVSRQAQVKQHWNPKKELIRIGQLNPSKPDEGFMFLEHFDLPGEDVPQVFQEEFGIPLPIFKKRVR